MKFSLKTFLVGLVLLGAAVGGLGRLAVTYPQVFMGVMAILSTFVPFFLAIVTILVVATRQKSRGLMIWAALLLIAPALGGLTMAVVGYSNVAISGRLNGFSTADLINKQLPNAIDQPRVWRELERRLSAGNLSAEEVDDAVRQLVKHMKQKSPQGWDQPLSWQQSFITAAVAKQKISEAVLLDLCDAFYGPKPVLELQRLRETSTNWELRIQYGSNWGRNSGIGQMLLWEVDRVLLDDQPLELRNEHHFNERWTGHCGDALPAGEHTVTAEVECAYVDEAKLIGLDTSSLPSQRWPKATKRWKQTVTLPLKVYTKDEPIVSMTTDPKLDPTQTRSVEARRLVVQTDEQGKKRLILVLEYAPVLSVALSYDVVGELDGQTVDMGGSWVVQKENSRSSGGTEFQGVLDTLSDEIRVARITLKPNPRHIENRSDVDEVWGGSIVLPSVRVERLDLEAAGENTEGS